MQCHSFKIDLHYCPALSHFCLLDITVFIFHITNRETFLTLTKLLFTWINVSILCVVRFFWWWFSKVSCLWYYWACDQHMIYQPSFEKDYSYQRGTCKCLASAEFNWFPYLKANFLNVYQLKSYWLTEYKVWVEKKSSSIEFIGRYIL